MLPPRLAGPSLPESQPLPHYVAEGTRVTRGCETRRIEGGRWRRGRASGREGGVGRGVGRVLEPLGELEGR